MKRTWWPAPHQQPQANAHFVQLHRWRMSVSWASLMSNHERLGYTSGRRWGWRMSPNGAIQSLTFSQAWAVSSASPWRGRTLSSSCNLRTAPCRASILNHIHTIGWIIKVSQLFHAYSLPRNMDDSACTDCISAVTFKSNTKGWSTIWDWVRTKKLLTVQHLTVKNGAWDLPGLLWSATRACLTESDQSMSNYSCTHLCRRSDLKRCKIHRV